MGRVSEGFYHAAQSVALHPTGRQEAHVVLERIAAMILKAYNPDRPLSHMEIEIDALDVAQPGAVQTGEPSRVKSLGWTTIPQTVTL